jgi:hypothetical protein
MTVCNILCKYYFEIKFPFNYSVIIEKKVKSYGHLLCDALKVGKLSTISLEKPVTAIFWVEDGASMCL